MDSHAFVAIQYENLPSLGRAILQINATRRQKFFYSSLIVTAPERGWIALLLGEGGGLVDHLLMRNLSGKLQTAALELRLSRNDFAYRLHQSGRTVSFFESNLPYYVNYRLRMLEVAREVEVLDLGEPIERFVLKRYHELQYPDMVSTLSLKIPDVLQAHYSGDAAALAPLLIPSGAPADVSSLLAPGFNPEMAFSSLISMLDLPFLAEHQVMVTEDGQPRQINGLMVTRPSTWHDVLPAHWKRLPALPAGLELLA